MYELGDQGAAGTGLLSCSYEFPPLGGGGSHVVAGLAGSLRAMVGSVDLVTMGRFGLPPRETVGGVKVHRVGHFRTRREICYPPEMAAYLGAAPRVLLRLVRDHRHTINHTHFIFPDGILAWQLKRRTGMRYVITAHGSDVPGYNPERFNGFHRLLAPIWRRVVRNAEAIVCPSRRLEALVVSAEPEARTVVIPNGIDLDRFRPAPTRRPAILIVARIFERKGIQFFLQALENRDYGFDIDIVGDGPYRRRLEKIATALKLPVRFHGWLDNGSSELRTLFETSRIFVYPSLAENFPIALLEAMAAGLAIITTHGTGCEEVTGDTALQVQPGSPGQIQQALDRLTADEELCREKGQRALARVREQFGWPSVARRYASLLLTPRDARCAG